MDPLSTQVGLDHLSVSNKKAFWIETPAGGPGGGLLLSAELGSGGAPQDAVPVLPLGFTCRTRVIGFGGIPYAVCAKGVVVFVRHEDTCLWVQWGDGSAPAQLTSIAETGCSLLFSGGSLSRDGTRWYGLQECVGPDPIVPASEAVQRAKPVRSVVSIDLQNQLFAVEEISAGHQYYSDPTLSDCEGKLAFVGWDDPELDFGESTLYLQYLLEDGGCSFRCDMIDSGVPICEPRFNAGQLYFVALKGRLEEEHRWSLCTFDEDKFEVIMCSKGVDFISPQWPPKLGAHSYDFDSGKVVMSPNGENISVMCLETKSLRPHLFAPTLHVRSVFSSGGRIVVLAASSLHPARILVDSAENGWQSVRPSLELKGPRGHQTELVSLPMDGTYSLQGILLRPSNPSPGAAQDPPFVLMRLREPGTLAGPVVSPGILFWLSKGWSVFDFDCGGYHARGRQYSKRVQQNLFAADVLSLAQQLLRKKHAVPGRLFLSGAGPLAGMCALECVLSQRNVFAGVVCTAALTDLEAFYQEADDRVLMHAAGLLDSFPPQWLPPTQETKKSWLPRSLALRANDLKVPVLLCHGRSDSIVPVSQTESFDCASGKVNKYIVGDGDEGLWDHSIPSSLAFLETQWRFLQHGDAPDMHIASQPGIPESTKKPREVESSAIVLQKRDVLVAGTVLAAVLVVGLGVYGFSRRRQEFLK